MIFLVGFLLALALVWYENKFIVLDVVGRPLFLSASMNQVALYLVRMVITYGSFAGLFFVYGAPLAGAAFVTYWMFSWATFRTYFGREVRRVAKGIMRSEPDDDPFYKTTEAEALEATTRIVTGNIKTAGRGDVF
ncbi:MAG TPA: hypothetical protein VMV27_06290 [Candidatus Binataceae bacterium]|nr:hypothetical protein [Candidatus Binataceae bacterium]